MKGLLWIDCFGKLRHLSLRSISIQFFIFQSSFTVADCPSNQKICKGINLVFEMMTLSVSLFSGSFFSLEKTKRKHALKWKLTKIFQEETKQIPLFSDTAFLLKKSPAIQIAGLLHFKIMQVLSVRLLYICLFF